MAKTGHSQDLSLPNTRSYEVYFRIYSFQERLLHWLTHRRLIILKNLSKFMIINLEYIQTILVGKNS